MSAEDGAPAAGAAPGHRAGFVAVVGAPNVGKSTLVNALAGRKVAGVSPKPQTTRRRILGIRTEPGCQIVFVDTPGLSESRHQLGDAMNRTALEAAGDADLDLCVVDASRLETAAEIERLSRDGRVPKILVLSKVDLVPKPSLLPLIARYAGDGAWAEVVPVSAREGDNVDRLRDVVRARLPEGPAWYDAAGEAAAAPDAQLVQEVVQESLFSRVHEEVPYGCAVLVESCALDGAMLRVEATILAERESHKPILIGAGGAKLKAIGTAARTELERILGRKVFLKLWVKVEEGWRDREAILTDLGYGGGRPGA